MILGIDPKVDYAFKYLLGRDSTRSILIDVLDKVLEPPIGHEILDIELLKNEFPAWTCRIAFAKCPVEMCLTK